MAFYYQGVTRLQIYLFFYYNTTLVIYNKGHKCVYSATGEVLDSFYTKASNRVYRLYNVFALL
jgi:hypothetical protein